MKTFYSDNGTIKEWLELKPEHPQHMFIVANDIEQAKIMFVELDKLFASGNVFDMLMSTPFDD